MQITIIAGVSALLLSILLLVFFMRKKKAKKIIKKSVRPVSTITQHMPTKARAKPLGIMLNTSTPDHCCQPARAILNKLIDGSDIPPLPLLGCSEPVCSCFLTKKFDERSGKERRQKGDRRSSIRFEDNQERRSNVDRRKDDTSWDDEIL